MSRSEPIESECSAEGLLRGGKGEISVSLASWARVSRRRRRFRLLVGVVRERRDTAFFIAGLSDWVTGQEDGENFTFLKWYNEDFPATVAINAFIIIGEKKINRKCCTVLCRIIVTTRNILLY